MKKFLRRILLIIFILCALGIMVIVIGLRNLKGEAVAKESVVLIYPHSCYDEVKGDIHSLLKDNNKRKAFDIYAQYVELHKRFKPGRYHITKDMSVVQIVRMISLGEQTPVRIVISNIRTSPQLAGIISRQIAADSTEVLSALYNKELRKELGYVRDSLMAMIIPNTYEVYWNTTPEQLLHRLKREHNRFWNEERCAKLEKTGLSRHEATTLASIVYEETKLKSDMPRVAGVYMNRLKRKWPLQADPTVKYALQRFDLKRVLAKHTRCISPYNTYRNRGLPPSPICVPSIAAIDAVLNYEKHNYLYFCASHKLDGSHDFARTLKEHNTNAQRYHAELNRRKIK